MNDRDSRAADRLLEELRRRVALQYCGIGNPVFGEGNPSSRLVLVGEAPGADEERAGRPFVGAAGRLLERLLAEVSLSRSQIWITNVVKLRPTREVSGTRQNRPPTLSEVNVHLPALIEELSIIRPKAVLCLGNVAARALISPTFRMGEGRGRWYNHPLGFAVSATYHPAYLLRRLSRRNNTMEDAVRSDLATAKTLAEQDHLEASSR